MKGGTKEERKVGRREGVETNQKQVRRIGSSQKKERRGEYKSVRK